MDLNEISAFISIVKNGGVTRAAVATGIPKATLSRKLQQLEKRLGATLLRRTTRKINLTLSGEEYFNKCSQLLKQIEDTENEVIESQSRPRGTIRFTAPVDTGAGPLAPLLYQFMKQYPEIKLDALFTDRRVDMIAEGFDVALRAGDLASSSLKAKKIGKEKFILIANSNYLKTHPPIKNAEQLRQHRLIGFSNNRESLEWILKTPEGKIKISFNPCFRTNSLSSATAMAAEGSGIALVPRFLANDLITKGKLERVLPLVYNERGEFALLYPEQKFLSPKVRIFIDFMSSELKNLEW